MGKPIIHVIGDSHSLLFQNERFVVHYIGSATAYRLHAKDSTTQSRKKVLSVLDSFKGKEETVLMVFGEIDSRIHIYNMGKKLNVSLDKMIENTVKAYIHFILELKRNFPYIQFAVFNILPAGEQKNIYNVKHYASREIQFKINQDMNRRLKKYCSQNGIIFIDIFDFLIDNKSNRIPEYVFDDVHYNSKITPFIIQEFVKSGIAL